MDPEITIISTAISLTAPAGGGLVLPSANASGSLQLLHGTDVETAAWIARHGLSIERMTEYCARFGFGAGSFWTTTRLRTACEYAEMNAAVMKAGVPSAVLQLALPVSVVLALAQTDPPLAEQWSKEDADYRFEPGAFATVNATMTNATVILTSEVQLND